MHQFILIFCLIGRPNDSEDIDLETSRKKSGPRGRPAKRKAPSPDHDDSVDELKPEDGSGGLLTSTAIRMFAGAGEPQSRAQVKGDIAMVAQRSAHMSNHSKIAGAVENLAAIVGRREVLDKAAAD